MIVRPGESIPVDGEVIGGQYPSQGHPGGG